MEINYKSNNDKILDFYPALNNGYSFHMIVFVMELCFIYTEEVLYDLGLGILIGGFGHS